MTILKIENNYSWLLTDNQEVKKKLWKLLRFRAEGYFHSTAYKMKIWDGFENFFNEISGKFLTGLLPEVRHVLKILNITYTTEDKREDFKFVVDFIDETFLPPKKLRDYQVDYVNEVIEHKRGIITAPTGSGKSLVACSIIKTLPEKTPTLFVCNRKQLVEQFYDELIAAGFTDVGRFHGTKKEINRSIIIATVQSAQQLGDFLPKVKVLIIDEIHEMTTTTAKKLYKKLVNARVRVGLSATAHKDDGKDKCQKYDVKGWIGPTLLIKSTESGKLTTKELQEKNILSGDECSFFVVEEPFRPYDTWIDAVTNCIAENHYLNTFVAKLVTKLNGRTLILVDRISHGDMLSSLIPGSFWVQGKDTIETRKEIIDKLKFSKDKVVAIATSSIFGVGVNFPINSLIGLYDSKSHHQVVQRFGRGLRLKEGSLKYFDFYYKTNEYLEDHSKKRIKVLEKEGHVVKIYKTIEEWEKDKRII